MFDALGQLPWTMYSRINRSEQAYVVFRKVECSEPLLPIPRELCPFFLLDPRSPGVLPMRTHHSPTVPKKKVHIAREQRYS